MKTTLFLLILFSFTNFSIGFAQWKICNNGLYSNKISCFIVDSNRTYAGTEGGIFMTTDYGDNWIAKNKGLKGLYGISIISLATDGNNIFAGTWFDGIFLSTDKGENWVRKSNGLPYYVFNSGKDTIFKSDVYSIIINGNNIFAGTEEGVYMSSDCGDNWILKNNGLPHSDSLSLYIHSFVTSDNKIFAGTRFGVFISTDNGENWFAKNKEIDRLIVLSLAVNGDNIYAGTEYGGIFLSTDNGDNWGYAGRKDTIIASIIIKGNYIFAAGHGVDISSNNGNNWFTKNSGLTCLGTKSLIINGEYIFAGDADCGIYIAKLSDLGITDVKETEQNNGIKIYPNPALDEFRLKFHSPIETSVQLRIFDYLSNCVLSQALQSTEGMNEKNINCEKLPQGYYFVKINLNEIVETVPLVLIK